MPSQTPCFWIVGEGHCMYFRQFGITQFWHPCYFLCCTITWEKNKLHFKNSLIDCGKSAAFLRKSSLCTPVKYKYNTPLSSTPIFMPTPKNMVDCLHQTLHFLQLSNVCVCIWLERVCEVTSGDRKKGRQENTNNFMFLFYSRIALKWFFYALKVTTTTENTRFQSIVFACNLF